MVFKRREGVERESRKRRWEGKKTKHGTSTTYSNRGWRCAACTKAASDERLRSKYKRVAATGIPLDVNHRARARRFGVPHENINNPLVFERDGWICGLCGDPVDREAKFPSARMATLDHIVPLSPGPCRPRPLKPNSQI